LKKKRTYEEIQQQNEILKEENAIVIESLKILKESEKLHRLTLENISDTIIITDDDGNMIYACPNTINIFGLAQEQVLKKKTIQQLMGSSICEIPEVHKNKEIVNIEWSIDHISGCQKFLLINVKSVDINGGTVLYVMHDISERRKTETVLKESEEKFQQLVNLSPGGIYQTDTQGDCVYANEKWLKMAGLSFNEAKGQGWINGIHPDDREKVGQAWYKMIESEGRWGFEYRFQNSSGKITWVYGLATLIKNANDATTGYLGINIDITEQKKAEKNLLDSQQNMASVLNNTQDAVVRLDKNFRHVFVNSALYEATGLSAEQYLGKTCEEIGFPEESCSFWQKKHESVIQNKKSETFEFNFLTANKGERTFQAIVSPEFNENKDVKSIISFMRDITERKRLESQVQQSQKMESLGTLTGGIAHDFNNLLYMIVGNTELALEDIPKWNPAYTNLEEIKSASLRAADIVKQLLNFSRKTDQKMIPIDAVTVIKDSLKFLRSTIPSTVKIHEQFSDDDIIILADSTQVNQIIMNLCVNASQSMEETGGTLKINIEKTICEAEDVKEFFDLVPGNYLKITVNDTGPGISPEIINRIFDPYFTTKEMGKGSGMGLSIVLGIIKNHGGAIWVDSSLGKGTTFSLLFPMVE